MKIRTDIVRIAFGGLIVAAGILTAASAFGWDCKGEALLGEKYGFGDSFVRKEGCIPVMENGLWGFIKVDGKVTIKPKYEEIGKPQKYEMYSSLGDKHLDRMLIPVKFKGKWGFVDQSGKEIIKPEFDQVGVFTSELTRNALGDPSYNNYCVVVKGNDVLLIDRKGKTKDVLGSGYDKIIPAKGAILGLTNGRLLLIRDMPGSRAKVTTLPDFFKVSIGEDFKLYDKNGDEMPLKIVGINDKPAAYLVDCNGAMRLYDEELSPLSTADYAGWYPKDNVVLFQRKDGKYDVFSAAERKIVGSTDKYVVELANGYMLFAPNADSKNVGLATMSDQVVLPAEYESIKFAKDGKYLFIKKDGKFGLATPAGEVILPCEYTNLTPAGDNVFVTGANGAGIYNLAQGKMVKPVGTYTKLGNYVNKYDAYWVGKGDKWGVISSDFAREIIPPVYNKISTGFSNTLDKDKYTFHVTAADGTVGVINAKTGKTIIPTGRYTGIKGYDLDGICVQKGNKVGLVDLNTGKQLVPPIHTEIIGKGNGRILAGDNLPGGKGIFYIYDQKGTLVKKQAFNTSQRTAIVNFMKTWLGNFPATYDF